MWKDSKCSFNVSATDTGSSKQGEVQYNCSVSTGLIHLFQGHFSFCQGYHSSCHPIFNNYKLQKRKKTNNNNNNNRPQHTWSNFHSAIVNATSNAWMLQLPSYPVLICCRKIPICLLQTSEMWSCSVDPSRIQLTLGKMLYKVWTQPERKQTAEMLLLQNWRHRWWENLASSVKREKGIKNKWVKKKLEVCIELVQKSGVTWCLSSLHGIQARAQVSLSHRKILLAL